MPLLPIMPLFPTFRIGNQRGWKLTAFLVIFKKLSLYYLLRKDLILYISHLEKGRWSKMNTWPVSVSWKREGKALCWQLSSAFAMSHLYMQTQLPYSVGAKERLASFVFEVLAMTNLQEMTIACHNLIKCLMSYFWSVSQIIELLTVVGIRKSWHGVHAFGRYCRFLFFCLKCVQSYWVPTVPTHG